MTTDGCENGVDRQGADLSTITGSMARIRWLLSP